MPEQDDVIDLAARRALREASDEDIQLTRLRRGKRCVHAAFDVDEKDRYVECRGCKARIDPMDALMMLAERSDAQSEINRRAKHAREDLASYRKHLEALKAEEKLIKARIKRARGRDA